MFISWNSTRDSTSLYKNFYFIKSIPQFIGIVHEFRTREIADIEVTVMK